MPSHLEWAQIKLSACKGYKNFLQPLKDGCGTAFVAEPNRAYCACMREEIQTFLRQLAAFRLLLVLSTGQRGIVWHGRLRATAASWSAEMGCTEREIMSITGHTTTASVSVYVRYAEQKTRAVNAIAKLSNRPLEQMGRKQGVTNIFKQGKKSD